MIDKVIFDSSIWIDIRRGNQKVIDATFQFIESDSIVLVDIICTEVLRGAKSDKDFATLSKIFSNFDILSVSWERVSTLAYKVSRKGFNPPLADLYIATCAIENKIGLVTKDKHFLSINAVDKFKLILV